MGKVLTNTLTKPQEKEQGAKVITLTP
jgi:hypothetical protein